MIETIRGTIAYVTAAVVAIGSPILATYAWLQPIVEGRDLAILLGFLGIITGGAVTFLFNSETASRASHASERAANLPTP